jgi:hypothetical protein
MNRQAEDREKIFRKQKPYKWLISYTQDSHTSVIKRQITPKYAKDLNSYFIKEDRGMAVSS